MNDQILEIKTALQILRPAHDVFEAIVDPRCPEVIYLFRYRRMKVHPRDTFSPAQ